MVEDGDDQRSRHERAVDEMNQEVEELERIQEELIKRLDGSETSLSKEKQSSLKIQGELESLVAVISESEASFAKERALANAVQRDMEADAKKHRVKLELMIKDLESKLSLEELRTVSGKAEAMEAGVSQADQYKATSVELQCEVIQLKARILDLEGALEGAMSAGASAEASLRDYREELEGHMTRQLKLQEELAGEREIRASLRAHCDDVQRAALYTMNTIAASYKSWDGERKGFKGSISDLMGMVSSHAQETASLHKALTSPEKKISRRNQLSAAAAEFSKAAEAANNLSGRGASSEPPQAVGGGSIDALSASAPSWGLTPSKVMHDNPLRLKYSPSEGRSKRAPVSPSASPMRVPEPFTSKLIRCYTGHQEAVSAVCTVGARLFTASQDNSARCFLIQRAEGEQASAISTYQGHKGPVSAMCVSLTHLYTASHDGTCIEWNLESGLQEKVFKPVQPNLFSRGVTAICLQGSTIYISMWVRDGSLFRWDLETGHSEVLNSGHEAPITALCTASGCIYSGGVKGRLHEWLCGDSRRGASLEGHTQEITSLTAHGVYLYSGCRDATIKQWSLETRRCTQTYVGHLSVVRAVWAGAMGLLSGSADGTVRFWSDDSSECKGLLQIQEAAVTALTVSNECLFTACADGEVRQFFLNSNFVHVAPPALALP